MLPKRHTLVNGWSLTGRDMVFSEIEMLLIRVTVTLVLLFGKQRMCYLVSGYMWKAE